MDEEGLILPLDSDVAVVVFFVEIFRFPDRPTDGNRGAVGEVSECVMTGEKIIMLLEKIHSHRSSTPLIIIAYSSLRGALMMLSEPSKAAATGGRMIFFRLSERRRTRRSLRTRRP